MNLPAPNRSPTWMGNCAMPSVMSCVVSCEIPCSMRLLLKSSRPRILLALHFVQYGVRAVLLLRFPRRGRGVLLQSRPRKSLPEEIREDAPRQRRL